MLSAIYYFVVGFIVLNAIIGMVTYVTLLERKFAARMQSRIGPYRVGPHGLLQPIADALKLMMKEDVVPRQADRAVYNLAPIVFLIPCMLIFATLPFAPGLGVADLNIGILFFLAVSAMEIVGLFMGGWGSNNKYALLSVMRAVNQIISYDLPFVFVALVPVLLAGSLRLSDIAAAQPDFFRWFIFYPVLGQLAFLAYIVTTLAAENRVPFDILEAESELIAGFRVEYSGMKFALIQLGEYAHVIGTSFLGALLFLGAWGGPGPAWLGPLWFLLKAMFVFLLVTWIRWSFVRIRVDQILAISWKLLLPFSLLLLMATAVVVAWKGAPGA
ncbi:MAG TPA: NADH-quinone oxidoreductase subunit NuoH [Methylomirabilota bacterium]|nr:NADH-quinone oxidoreductase subunit NuoH [Methylomirabilota bacterium]